MVSPAPGNHRRGDRFFPKFLTISGKNRFFFSSFLYETNTFLPSAVGYQSPRLTTGLQGVQGFQRRVGQLAAGRQGPCGAFEDLTLLLVEACGLGGVFFFASSFGGMGGFFWGPNRQNLERNGQNHLLK